jgi:hypothetical protein
MKEDEQEQILNKQSSNFRRAQNFQSSLHGFGLHQLDFTIENPDFFQKPKMIISFILNAKDTSLIKISLTGKFSEGHEFNWTFLIIQCHQIKPSMF